jgi:hypothetical protein
VPAGEIVDKALQNAIARADAFIATHPEYSRNDVPPPTGGHTNKIVFARRGSDLVVFKIFCEDERKERECFGMRHWQSTGLVPELICECDASMIVMSFVQGTNLTHLRKIEGDEYWHSACRAVGHAIASLALTPLSAAAKCEFESRFYGRQSLRGYLTQILSLGRKIHERDPDFKDDYWKQSLDFMESQIDVMLAEPSTLYHQDVSNFYVRNGRFQRFFDLEMCRVGTPMMQLGSSLLMMSERRDGWSQFKAGWQDALGRPLASRELRAAVGFNSVMQWRVISRYMSYDGTPGTGFAWASPADPDRTRKKLEDVREMVES